MTLKDILNQLMIDVLMAAGYRYEERYDPPDCYLLFSNTFVVRTRNIWLNYYPNTDVAKLSIGINKTYDLGSVNDPGLRNKLIKILQIELD